jgi:hypothetical protein
MRSVLVGLLVVSGLFLALGGLALATLPPDPDFRPFTMRITTWMAAASQREGEAPQPGTLNQVLVYRSRENWEITVVGSTWDPRMVGHKTELNGVTHSTYVAQAQKLFRRVIGQDEAKMAPFPWVYPGLLNGLSRSGDYQVISTTPVGTTTFIGRDSRTNTRADGTLEVLTGTVLVFDGSSGLPLSMQKYHDGALDQSVTYEVLSRP